MNSISGLLGIHGEDTIKQAITYVDESAQSTGNKNRWKDWNLVLRKMYHQWLGRVLRQPPTRFQKL